MKTTYLLLLMLLCIVLTSAGPLKYKNKHKTDYCYYCDKYGEDWDPHDTLIYNSDTLYIYKLGGQYFKFNQEGKIIINKYSF